MLQINIRNRTHNNTTTLYLDYFVNGQRIVKSTGISYKTEEERPLALFKAEQIKNQIIQADLDDNLYLKDFDTKYNRNHYEAKTKASRNTSLKAVLKFDPTITLNRITRDWMANYVAYLESKHLKASGIAVKIAYVKSCLHIAKRENLIKDVPDFQGLLPKVQKANRQFLTIEEIKKFKAVEPRGKFCKLVQKAFLFACFTGLRLSDCANIRYENIQNGILKINMIKTKNELIVPLTANALHCLGNGSCGKVFVGLDASHTTQVTRALKRICKQANIDKHITFHCSRHSFAVNALKYSNNLFVVSKLLGHTKITTTQTYLHCLEEDKIQALAQVPTI